MTAPREETNMSKPGSLHRRRVLAGAAAGAALGTLGFPAIVRGQTAGIKIGIIHPVTGALSFSGNQGRAGAQMAVEAVNAAGGIKALGGAKLEPIYADAQSKPDIGAAEVEKLNEAGVAAILGAFASAVTLATTQAAARHGIPHVVDVAVADQVVQRGLTNVFRFGPGIANVTANALENLVRINDAAGKPCRTVMIVHEESAFGTGMATTLNAELPKRGFEILETIKHANPTRDFSNIVLRVQAKKPDLIIPSNYYDEYVLFARTLQQQKVHAKGIFSILGGGASSYRFVKEFPQAAAYVMDTNHWFDPRKQEALKLKEQVEKKGLFYTYELFMNYGAVMLLADAIERAGKADRESINAALASNSFETKIMPYGPIRFEKGDNTGARPVTTQVLDGDIKVIHPLEFASGNAVFPIPERKG
jgi:branched-chain amino acid transport system substrate-binding protein